MKSNVRRRPSAYTLIEILVALGILSLAIGAASQLSLGQSVTEEINQKETMAVNYGENAARLWQLGMNTPQNLLLRVPDSDSTLMPAPTLTTPANGGGMASGTLSGGGDYGISPIQVDAMNVSVTWKPLKKNLGDQSQSTDTTTLTFPVVRLKSERR